MLMAATSLPADKPHGRVALFTLTQLIFIGPSNTRNNKASSRAGSCARSWPLEEKTKMDVAMEARARGRREREDGWERERGIKAERMREGERIKGGEKEERLAKCREVEGQEE